VTRPTIQTHDCPGGCGRPVERHRVACRECWYRLPADLRRAITNNWKRNLDAHRLALVDAVQWYRDHPAVRP
jgi:hypothetical protein